MSILASTIRLCFGMAGDDQLPASSFMAKVISTPHTPIGACLVIGLLSAVPFIQFRRSSTIALAATASIYFSYLLGSLAVMRARSRGWPRTRAPFALGTWGNVGLVPAHLLEPQADPDRLLRRGPPTRELRAGRSQQDRGDLVGVHGRARGGRDLLLRRPAQQALGAGRASREDLTGVVG
jgi:hypothetical protein